MNIVHFTDCMDFMANKPDNYYDLAICDPPYGIGMDGGNVGYRGFNVLKKNNWDKDIPSKAYFNKLFEIAFHQIIWGGNYFGLYPSRCFLVWDKGEGFKGRTYAEAELAWTSFDRNVRIFKHDPLAKNDYCGKIHPCQKPIALYKWLLQNYAKPDQTIFDSHVGSGSIRIACHDLGFDFEGCEIDPEYWKAQEDRYNNHIQQADLFDKTEIQKLVYRRNNG